MTASELKSKLLSKKLWSNVLNIFLWVFLAFSLVMTVLAFTAQASGNGNPTIAGKMMFFVKSDSMEGPDGFYTGDMIISRVLSEAEKTNLKENEVITFYTDLYPDDGIDSKELNTHRIVEILKNADGSVYAYVTKGDNKEYRDEPVSTADIVAVWTGKRVPVVGSILGFLQSKTGFGLCVVLPLLLFFLYKLFLMIKAILELRREKQGTSSGITAEEEEEIKRRAVEEYLAKLAAEKEKETPASPEEDSSASEDSHKSE